ncbi:Lcl C-terminal domain-containing protein [Vibrio cholerae]
MFDKQTQLVWMRCSLGQSWDGKNCTGKAQEISWDDAIKLKHNFAGSTAWRLPTVEELDSLVYCSKGRKPSERPNGKLVYDTDGICLGDNYQRPTINIRAFPNTSNSVYWSSSPYA